MIEDSLPAQSPAAGPEPSPDNLLLELAVEAAGVGIWDWDLLTGALHFDDRLLELFGIERADFTGDVESFLLRVHPEDRQRVGRQLSATIRSGGTFLAEYRIVRGDGAVRWVSSRGHALPGQDGSAARMIGAAFDSTLAQEGEARTTRILDAMPVAFLTLDTDGRITFANPQARRFIDMLVDGVLGATLKDLFPGIDGTHFQANLQRAVRTGEPVEFEAFYPAPVEAWFEVRAWPSPDGLSIYLLDVTARREAQTELNRTARRATLIAKITEALTDTLDAEQGVADLARLLVPATADWCVVTVADGADPLSGRDWRRNLRDLGWWHRDPEQGKVLAQYAATRIPALREDSYQAQALRTRQILVAENARETVTEGLEPGPAQESYRTLDPETAIFVPMVRRGRVIGLITLGRSKERGPFSSASVEMFHDLAGRAALALDNARVYSTQRDLAEGLQRSLLTEPPTTDRMEVSVRYVPSVQAAQVGGDWYDAFVQPDGDLMVVIGDVVGHDTEAAAAMGQVRGLLRGIAVTSAGSPASILSSVDRAMDVLQVDTTATVVAATFRRQPSGEIEMTWSNAGHPPALVLTTGPGDVPQVEVLSSQEPNLLMGLDTNCARSDQSRSLQPGSVVLLYTDGLVERRGQDLDEGIDLLCTELTALAAEANPGGSGLGSICDALLARLLSQKNEDDVALLAVQVR